MLRKDYKFIDLGEKGPTNIPQSQKITNLKTNKIIKK